MTVDVQNAVNVSRGVILLFSGLLIYYAGDSVKADPSMQFKLVFAEWLMGQSAALSAKQLPGSGRWS